MNPIELFRKQRSEIINGFSKDSSIKQLSNAWMTAANFKGYSYSFDWLGRPIIQYPQDIVAFQEIVWMVRPDLIVETGIAHGGSLILSASLLAMLDYCDAVEAGEVLDPARPKRRVLGIDIDIRSHNRDAIEAHPMAGRIDMIEGSSVDQDTIGKVHAAASGYKKVLVCLDSNHTHEHVYDELQAYASLVTSGSYLIVYDTVVEDMPAEMFPDRPWGPGDNPKTAVHAWLTDNPDFEIDKSLDHKLQISVAPDGFLRRL